MRTLILLTLMGLVGAAWAEPAKVAILPIESPDEAAGLRVHAALRAAVEASPEMADNGPVAMTVEEAKLSFSCFDAEAACMAQVGEMLAAKRLLWGALTRTGGTWQLELHLIDVPGKAELRAVRLDAKGPGDFPHLAQAAEAFVRNRKVAPAKVVLRVTSRPSDAEVRVDGVPQGKTPITLRVDPGQRAVSVRKRGFAASEQMVRVGPKGDAVDVTLARQSPAAGVKPPPPPPPDRVGKSGTFWLGVGLAGVATAAAVTGGVFRVQEHQAADEAAGLGISAEREALESDYTSANTAATVSFVVAGLAAAGAVTAFVVDWRRGEAEPRAAVSIAPGGFSVIGRF